MSTTRTRSIPATHSELLQGPTLPPIVIVEAIPGYNGLLPIDRQGTDLTITLPWWSGVQQDMRLQVAWKLFTPDNPGAPGVDDLVGNPHIVTPAEYLDPSTIFSVFVPQALLGEANKGEYVLRVRALHSRGP